MSPTTGTIYETLAESVRVFYCLSFMFALKSIQIVISFGTLYYIYADAGSTPAISTEHNHPNHKVEDKEYLISVKNYPKRSYSTYYINWTKKHRVLCQV